MNDLSIVSSKIQRICMLFGNNTDLLLFKLTVLRRQCKTTREVVVVDDLIKNIKGLI